MTDTPTPASEIEAIRKRLEAATPGPWTMDMGQIWAGSEQDERCILRIDNGYSFVWHNEADNMLVENAPTDIRFLLDHIAALEARLREVVSECPSEREWGAACRGPLASG